MKTITSIILAISLVAMSVQAQSTNAQPIQPKSALCYGFCLFCLVAGGVAIVYVYTTTPGPGSTVTVVLDESTDGRGSWHPVATNTVTLVAGEPMIEVFRKTIDKRDPNRYNFYKARPQK